MLAKSAEYLVNYGKTGTLGRFHFVGGERFARGDRVVLEGERGLTVGVVLCEAAARQARILGGSAAGEVLRRAGVDDEALRLAIVIREQEIFDTACAIAARLDLPMEILDAELSLDGRAVILQYL